MNTCGPTITFSVQRKFHHPNAQLQGPADGSSHLQVPTAAILPSKHGAWDTRKSSQVQNPNQNNKKTKQLFKRTQKLASTLVCPANHCLPLAAPTLQHPSFNLRLVWEQPSESLLPWASSSHAITRPSHYFLYISIPPPFISSRNNPLPASSLQLQTGQS